MDDYTPTTEEVRESFASGVNFESRTPFLSGRKQFNRWLAARDAHIRATAINEVEEHLVRRDCFTERTFRMIDELRGTR